MTDEFLTVCIYLLGNAINAQMFEKDIYTNRRRHNALLAPQNSPLKYQL